MKTAKKEKQIILSWEEVVETQLNGCDAFFVPNKQERQGQYFERKTILLTDIPTEHFTTLSDYEEDDCLDDVEVILPLIRAYQKGKNVPPIILYRNYKIIDGFHRMSALNELDMTKIEVFMEI